jgi:hypothetical protein
MRDIEALKNAFAESGPRDLAKQIVADLNLPSPLIGAQGPPDHTGPEEAYIQASEDTSQTERQNFGEALCIVLLDEAAEIARNGRVRNPLLLFNIFSVLEAVQVPKVAPVLETLRDYEQPLRDALADKNDDLYAQLLLAHAVNQHASKQDIEFWLSLLDHDNVDDVSAGIVGLRESGWENAVTHLPRVKQAHEQHPELGPFEDEVMLLVDTYPTMNWPDCARDHVIASDIWQLLAKHGADRYVPEIDELEGSAANIIKRAGKQDEVQRRREKLNISPALALVTGNNGH